MLNLEERTTGRTGSENRMLEVSDVDQRTSVAKLASSERKLQKIEKTT